MIVSVPRWIDPLSEELAKARSAISAGIYREGTDKYRGSDEMAISKLGIKAELVVRFVLWEDPTITRVAFSPMIDVKPIVGADMVFDGETYDIKGVKVEKGCLMVNYNAHNNPKKICDYYIFVIFQNTNATIQKYRYSDVSQWPVVDAKYSKVYQCRM